MGDGTYGKGAGMRGLVATLAERKATLAAGLFAGASVYINLVEHPARMQAGTDVALAEFAPSYHRATVTQFSWGGWAFLSVLGVGRLRTVWGCLGGGVLL